VAQEMGARGRSQWQARDYYCDISRAVRMRSAIARRPLVSSARSAASSAARPSVEMWWADSPAMAQRLWLTTSTLWPSGSSTKAP
jgi:hypothetical protein